MPDTPPLAAVPHRWCFTVALLGLLVLLTKHHHMQQPVHVGMFAGSLLQRGDWDH